MSYDDPVHVPGGMKLCVNHNVKSVDKWKQSFIRVTSTYRSLVCWGVHPQIARKLTPGKVLSAKIWGSIAMPFEGGSLTPDMYEVVM